MDTCIFCKIIKGEVPGVKVFENEHVLAFLDISQVTKGHTLVIPKKHIEDIYAMDEETAGQVFRVVPKIAKSITDALDAKGMNIAINNREIAGQTVFHSHIHLVPRYTADDGFNVQFTNNMDQYSKDDLAQIAESIEQKLK